METSGEIHNCRNCGNSFTGKYCNACGEKAFHAQEKSLKYIVEEAFHFLTHFEGSIFSTIKTVFTRPGKLSLDYCNGIRKRYYKPTSLYFMIIILYLLFPIFKGLDMPLKNYESTRWEYPHHAIAAKMEQRHISYEELAVRYEHKSHTTSKFVLLLVLPLCCIILAALYPRKKMFFDHFILSIEINTFFIAATFILLPLLLAIAYTLVPPLRPYTIGDDISFIIYLFAVGSFTAVAFRRFYQSPVWVSILKTIVFLFFHLIIVFFLYKLVLFTVVMALI